MNKGMSRTMQVLLVAAFFQLIVTAILVFKLETMDQKATTTTTTTKDGGTAQQQAKAKSKPSAGPHSAQQPHAALFRMRKKAPISRLPTVIVDAATQYAPMGDEGRSDDESVDATPAEVDTEVYTGAGWETPRCNMVNVGVAMQYAYRPVIIVAIRAASPAEGGNERQLLERWLQSMTALLPAALVKIAQVIVVEQSAETDLPFNKGLLMNIGYDYGVQKRRLCDLDYIILHDVHHLPSKASALFGYFFRDRPTQLLEDDKAWIVTQSEQSTDAVMFSSSLDVADGPILFPIATFVNVNGFSNTLQDGSQQADNMAQRVLRTTKRFHQAFVGHAFHATQSSAESKPTLPSNVPNKPNNDDVTSGLSTLQYQVLQAEHYHVAHLAVTHIIAKPGKDRSEAAALAPQIVAGPQPKSRRRRLTCSQLFGSDSVGFILENHGRCIAHASIGWRSCQLGTIRVRPDYVRGSKGGEDVNEVAGRLNEEETLGFSEGAVLLQQPIPGGFMEQKRLAGAIKTFTEAAEVDEPLAELDTGNSEALEDAGLHLHPTRTHLFVDRGDYANPCMGISKIYNTFVVMQKFQVDQHRIVFLDGHARSSIDEMWEAIFDDVTYLKQLPDNEVLSNAIVVNTASALGDEGVKAISWATSCEGESYLHQFRDFVLDKLNIKRSNTYNKRATFLIRRDYMAHPRSNGMTDRTLVNETADIEYIRSLVPDHTVDIVCFETMSVADQIRQIAQTDILFAVHGAGNIHTMFLPDHGTLVEFVPRTFEPRVRFRFIAKVMGLGYEPRAATKVSRATGFIKVSLSTPTTQRKGLVKRL